MRGCLYAGQTAVLHGPPEAGKSYFAWMMALVLAAGGDWHGVLVAGKPRKVLYVQTEGTVYDPQERVAGMLPLFPAAGENLTAVFPRGLDLAKNRGVADAVSNDAEVAFFDTLSSASSGSLNDDDNVGKVEDTIWEMKERNPRLAVVLIHHDHRDRYDPYGKKVRQEEDAIAGSYKVRAMSDQVWHFRKRENDTEPTFRQTKGRSRFHKIDPFGVLLDEETGVLTPTFPSGGKWAFKVELAKTGSMTARVAVAWATGAGLTDRTIRRWKAELVREGLASLDDRGVLRWTGPKGSIGGQTTK